MADPISLMAVTTVASAGLGAASSITGGMGAKAASEAQAGRLEQAAAYGRVQADQSSVQLSEELNKTLGNIDVIRAAAGVDPTSPTSAAIRDRQEFVSNRQRTTSVNNILRQADQSEADANYARAAGDFALRSSYLDAGTKVASAVAAGGKNGSLGKLPKFGT